MKGMRCVYCLMVLAALFLCIGGCAMAETYASRADVLAKAGLTEKDVESIDVDQFIQDEQITPDLLSAISGEDLRSVLEEMISDAAVVSHEFLFTEESLPFSEFDMDAEQLQRIAVVSTNDALIPSLLIDFTAGKAYFSNGYLFADLSIAEKVTELNAEHMTNIQNALQAANISQWSNQYEGDAQGLSYYESVVIQTNEGIYRYEKIGQNADAPDTTTNFMLALYNMFW